MDIAVIDEMNRTLKETFGHQCFREGQREPIESVLAGHDAVVVMPTGSGKSLCYQLVAMMLPGTTIVVSPLIALMQDQALALQKRGISAVCVNSTLSRKEMSQRLLAIRNNECKLIYAAPERFRNNEFLAAIKAIQVSLIAIDEAHCISQWGHDFRPDYLGLDKVIEQFPGVRVMALTATATPAVREDIIRQLCLDNGKREDPFVEVLGFSRPNLHISVSDCNRPDDKLKRLLDIVLRRQNGIVYVSTRKHALEVFDQLCTILECTKKDIQVICYHGAMSSGERAMALQEFLEAKHPVVVATTAFGMGIDRADIRFVVHWDIPGGIEQYYQEIGRAGRDGKPSECELLYSYADVKIQEFFIDGANPNSETAVSLWREFRKHTNGFSDHMLETFQKQLCIKNGIIPTTVVNVLINAGYVKRIKEGYDTQYQVTDGVTEAEVIDLFLARKEKYWRDRRRLRNMIDFVYHESCRHQFVLDYFGDQSKRRACGGCDNCDYILMKSKKAV